jgi:hypothetical protein
MRANIGADVGRISGCGGREAPVADEQTAARLAADAKALRETTLYYKSDGGSFFPALRTLEIAANMDTASESLARVTDALREYGVHPDLCSIWVEEDDVTGLVFPVGTCNCGLAAALAAGSQEPT